jgi:hypothetical protein
MNYRNSNGIKDVQVMLKESGLYTSGIDGAWGGGSLFAMMSLLTAYKRMDLPNIPPSTIPGDATVKAIVSIQDLLKAAGLYDGKVDGVYGKGTKSGVRKALDGYIQQHRLPRYKAAWSTKVSKEFLDAVIAGCKARNWPDEAVDWLMSCMCFETGGTFSPTIQNGAGAKYFGLIQFGDMAAADLKTTTASLRVLPQIEQLKWVFAYFDMWAKRGKTYTQLEDFYLTIFYPKAVGLSADTVIFRKDVEATGYRQNSGFDYDKDGQITVGEINARLYDTYYKGMDTVNRVLTAA